MSEKKVIVKNRTAEYLAKLDEEIPKALEAVGITAGGFAKLKCPVDTGRLRNSITHAVSESEKAVYIGTNVEYAAYVEMGTVNTRAQPYLKPAATEHEAEYVGLIKQYLKGR